MEDVKKLEDRIITLKFVKQNNYNVISAYAPQVGNRESRTPQDKILENF